MKVLFYSDTVFSFGGVQRVLAEISKRLSTEMDVTILTSDSPVDTSMYDYRYSHVKFEQIEYPKPPFLEKLFCKAYSFLFKKFLPHTKFTSLGYARSSFLPAYRKRLVEKINAGDYDVVVGVHAFQSLHIAAISHQIKVKTIAWIHNSFQALFEKESPYLPGLDKHFAFQMQEMNHVFVLSQADKEMFDQKMDLPTTVMYNPLTVQPHGEGNPSHKRFVSVGRFSKGHKGFDLLIEAFSIFAKDNRDWTLEIVGEGPEEALYRQLITKHGLEDRVILSPFTRNIQSHYAQSSIYVLSSRWEGFGLVLIEAIAHSLPIIASDLPVTRELLYGKDVAILFEKENIHEMARCMSSLANDPSLISRMGENAKTYAKEFEMESVIKQWITNINPSHV